MNLQTIFIVGIGGFLGTISRYVSVEFVKNRFHDFPYGTLAVNLLGSFIIGLVLGLNLTQDKENNNVVLFLTTGFCGGFTTFSAFTVENMALINQKLYTPAIIYMVASVTLGLAAVYLGTLLGRFLSAST